MRGAVLHIEMCVVVLGSLPQGGSGCCVPHNEVLGVLPVPQLGRKASREALAGRGSASTTGGLTGKDGQFSSCFSLTLSDLMDNANWS